MTKKVEVTLVGIKNIKTGSDPGDELEIYGDLYVKTAFHNGMGFQPISTFRMWHKNSSDREDIREGLMLPINAVQEVFLELNHFLLLGGHLAEHDDTNPNDNLGFIDVPIPYIDISSNIITPYVRFQESTQIVHAQYSIRQI